MAWYTGVVDAINIWYLGKCRHNFSYNVGLVLGKL